MICYHNSLLFEFGFLLECQFSRYVSNFPMPTEYLAFFEKLYHSLICVRHHCDHCNSKDRQMRFRRRRPNVDPTIPTKIEWRIVRRVDRRDRSL